MIFRNVFVVIVGAALVAAVTFGVVFPNISADPGCVKTTECAQCHKDSVPMTHTRRFVDHAHGASALANPSECLDCHENTECDDCHTTLRPTWHTDAFTTPGAGHLERDEHTTIANEKQETCGTCHTDTFQQQCAACHRPDEVWNDGKKDRIP